jgi:hypothetical protein
MPLHWTPCANIDALHATFRDIRPDDRYASQRRYILTLNSRHGCHTSQDLALAMYLGIYISTVCQDKSRAPACWLTNPIQ